MSANKHKPLVWPWHASDLGDTPGEMRQTLRWFVHMGTLSIKDYERACRAIADGTLGKRGRDGE